jgi:hypothetical protein
MLLRYHLFVDLALISTLLQPYISGLPSDELKKLHDLATRKAVDQAFGDVQGEAKSEIDALSESTKEDLRLQILQNLDQGDREIWSAVMAMRSSERFTTKLVTATWGLAAATCGLVIATIVLVVVTMLHH